MILKALVYIIFVGGFTTETDDEMLRSLVGSDRCIRDRRESDVIKMSYGRDSEKSAAKQLANHLGIKGNSSYVRVSQLKRQALDKLKKAIAHSQVTDYL